MANSRTIEAQWLGPFAWRLPRDRCVFDQPVASAKGVYVWTVSPEDANFAYYVGETGVSYSKRLGEHASAYLGGVYRIFDASSFIAGKRSLLWDGTWKPDSEARIGEFLRRTEELSAAALALLDAMNLWLLPLPDASNKDRKRIEAAIGKACKRSQPPGPDYFDEVVRFQAGPLADDPLRVQTPASPIWGVPSEFSA